MTTDRLARLAAAVEIPLIITLAPALLFPTPARLLVLGPLAVVWACLRAAGRPGVPPTPLNPALLGLWVMVGVSLFVTFDVIFSLGKVSGVLLGSVLFLAVARWLTTGERLRVAVWAFLAAGAMLAVIGLVGADSYGAKFPGMGVTMRVPQLIRGVPGAERGFNPNAVSGCLILFVPLQVALLWSRACRSWLAARSLLTWWALVGIQMALLGVTTLTLVAMQSRGAWVGLAAAVMGVLLWTSRWPRALVGVGLAGAIAAGVIIGPQQLIERAGGIVGQNLPYTLSVRRAVWSRAVDIIRAHPITGIGMNAFRQRMEPLPKTFGLSPDSPVPHAHNHLLQAALDVGIPGLIAYLALWAMTARLLVRVGRHAPERAHRTIAAGLGAGLLAHFVFGMTDVIPLGAKVGVLFWLSLALAVGLARVALPPQSRVPAP